MVDGSTPTTTVLESSVETATVDSSSATTDIVSSTTDVASISTSSDSALITSSAVLSSSVASPTLTATTSDLPMSTQLSSTSIATSSISSSITIPSITPTLASSDNHTNTGAIVGGVIGGVAGLAIIGAVVFIFLRKRKRPSFDQEVFRPDNSDDDYGYNRNTVYRNSGSSSTPMAEQAPQPPNHNYYNPNNQSVSY